MEDTNAKTYTAEVAIWMAGENATGIAGEIADAIEELLEDSPDTEVGLGSYDLLDCAIKTEVTPQQFVRHIYDICNKFAYDLWIGHHPDGKCNPGVIQVWVHETRLMPTEELTDWLLPY